MTDDTADSILAEDLLRIARSAGDAILAVYAQPDFDVKEKEDLSPLTEADLAANMIIMDELELLFPDIPILSEEEALTPWEERRHWYTMFVVDPLDGTREFLKRNGEFTVNIALVRDGEPVIGVVHAPVLQRSWFTDGVHAYVVDDDGQRQIQAAKAAPVRYRIVASRSHADAALATFLDSCPPHDAVAMGSSIKLCLVADGSADLYPRLAPTMEWDTAAADAVCRAAGAIVTDLAGLPLSYNKPNLHNPHFIVAAPSAFDWRAVCSLIDEDEDA